MTTRWILACTICLTLAGCGNNKKENANANAAKTVTAGAGSVAYVDMDTLQEKCQICIDTKAALEQKMQSYQADMQKREQALQQMQANIQKRMQGGQITSEAQYKQEVVKYQQQENAYLTYRNKVQQEMAKEQENSVKAVRDSIHNYLAEYNKTKKYTLVIEKVVTLYADPALDITDEVVAGMNKRYGKKK